MTNVHNYYCIILTSADLLIDDLLLEESEKESLKCIAAKREYIFACEASLVDIAVQLNQIDILKDEIDNKSLHQGLY